MKALNIGPTIRGRLETLGILTVQDIRRVGPAAIYSLLSQDSGRRLPVCYYLYSLQGAIENRDWRSFSREEKTALRRTAGLA